MSKLCSSELINQGEDDAASVRLKPLRMSVTEFEPGQASSSQDVERQNERAVSWTPMFAGTCRGQLAKRVSAVLARSIDGKMVDMSCSRSRGWRENERRGESFMSTGVAASGITGDGNIGSRLCSSLGHAEPLLQKWSSLPQIQRTTHEPIHRIAHHPDSCLEWRVCAAVTRIADRVC